MDRVPGTMVAQSPAEMGGQAVAHVEAQDDAPRAPSLADLRQGEEGALETIDLDRDLMHRLMELGFLPGALVTAGRSAPGGDPRLYLVDGAEIALRRETAVRLKLRPALPGES